MIGHKGPGAKPFKPYAPTHKLRQGRRISARNWKRFDALAEIFERKPDLDNRALARRLHLPLGTTQFTLRLMKKYDPYRYGRRADPGKPPVKVIYPPSGLVFPRGKTVTRRLRIEEIKAQHVMVAEAMRHGIPFEQIQRAIPSLTRIRFRRILQQLRKKKALGPEHRFATKSRRLVGVLQSQYRLIARLTLANQTDKEVIRRALNRQQHAIGDQKRTFPIKTTREVRNLRRGLTIKIGKAVEASTKQARGGEIRWNLTPLVDLAEYLDLTYRETVELAKRL